MAGAASARGGGVAGGHEGARARRGRGPGQPRSEAGAEGGRAALPGAPGARTPSGTQAPCCESATRALETDPAPPAPSPVTGLPALEVRAQRAQDAAPRPRGRDLRCPPRPEDGKEPTSPGKDTRQGTRRAARRTSLRTRLPLPRVPAAWRRLEGFWGPDARRQATSFHSKREDSSLVASEGGAEGG